MNLLSLAHTVAKIFLLCMIHTIDDILLGFFFFSTCTILVKTCAFFVLCGFLQEPYPTLAKCYESYKDLPAFQNAAPEKQPDAPASTS